jgi:hypothetical protein
VLPFLLVTGPSGSSTIGTEAMGRVLPFIRPSRVLATASVEHNSTHPSLESHDEAMSLNANENGSWDVLGDGLLAYLAFEHNLHLHSQEIRYCYSTRACPDLHVASMHEQHGVDREKAPTPPKCLNVHSCARGAAVRCWINCLRSAALHGQLTSGTASPRKKY